MGNSDIHAGRVPFSILAWRQPVPTRERSTKAHCLGVIQKVRDVGDRQLGFGQIVSGEQISDFIENCSKTGGFVIQSPPQGTLADMQTRGRASAYQRAYPEAETG